MFSLVFYFSILLTLGGFFSGVGWWFDVMSHFRMQYFFIQVFFSVFFLMNRNWFFLFMTIFFAVINLMTIKHYYTENPNKNFAYRMEAGKVKILEINLNVKPADDAKIVKLIYDVGPEILVLLEVQEERLRALSQVLNQYQTREFVIREDNFGIGFFTSLPVERVEFKNYGKSNLPTVVATLLINNQPLNLVAVHAMPPDTEDHFKLRNDQLSAIANDRAYFGENLVVIGDLNTSGWSEAFENFLKKMRLRDSRLSFGVQPTWPATIPFLLTPIDHCLVDEKIAVLDRRVGPAVGSDHYPLTVELGLYK